MKVEGTLLPEGARTIMPRVQTSGGERSQAASAWSSVRPSPCIILCFLLCFGVGVVILGGANVGKLLKAIVNRKTQATWRFLRFLCRCKCKVSEGPRFLDFNRPSRFFFSSSGGRKVGESKSDTSC
ncbi:unnamed protein product [Hapterophycus canaliculatus]